MNTLIHDIFQTTRSLSKELNHTLKEHNLFSSQWSVLYCIHQHGEMTLTEIWKYLNVEAPTVTRTVKRLEELGWLDVSAGEDRREKMVTLSSAAEERLPCIQASIASYEEAALKELTNQEQDLLRELLNKLTRKGTS